MESENKGKWECENRMRVTDAYELYYTILRPSMRVRVEWIWRKSVDIVFIKMGYENENCYNEERRIFHQHNFTRSIKYENQSEGDMRMKDDTRFISSVLRIRYTMKANWYEEKDKEYSISSIFLLITESETEWEIV